jgi:hypothetical protein
MKYDIEMGPGAMMYSYIPSAMKIGPSRAGRPLPPGRFLVLISVRGWVEPRAILRLEGLGQFKNQMTSSGNEHATFQSVA